MATYVNDLRLKEIGTGESSGTWGTETNVNLELIGEALGFGTEAITTNADTHTTTVADGSTDPGRAMYIKYTGTLDSACTITIGPNTINRLHYIENATSGSQNIIISQGSGANITIPAGDTKAVYLDGAGSGAAVVDVFASFSAVDLKVQDDLTVTDDATIGGTLGVTGILTCTDDIIIGDGKTIGSASDVDAMTIASNGQVTFTQTLIGTALDISGDIDVDGTANLDIVDIDGATNIAAAVTMATTNKIQFRDDAIHISSTADGQLDLVADTEIQIAATTIDVNGNLDVSGTTVSAGKITADAGIDIDNINIDGTTIALSSGDLTLDVAGDIILDADGADFKFRDGGAGFFTISNSSLDAVLKVEQSNEDMLFKGNDGGSEVTALTLDMSDAGSGSFGSRLGIGVAAHASAALNLTNTSQHIRFNNGSELAVINLDSDGILDLWAHGDDESITFRTGTSTGTVGLAFVGQGGSAGFLGLGTTAPSDLLHLKGADPTIRFEDTSGDAYAQIEADSADEGTIRLLADPGNAGANTVIRFDTDGSEKMRLAANGDFMMGTTVAPVGVGLAVNTAISSSSATAIEIQQATNGANKAAAAFGIAIGNGGEGTNAADLFFQTASGGSLGENARMFAGGGMAIGRTNTSFNNDGMYISDSSGSFVYLERSAGTSNSVLYLHRRNGDGELISFYESNSQEGSISVSGSTVSYNGFSGTHDSSGSGVSSSTAVGTVLSTIDEEHKADHAKVKVSNTASDKRVYGVLQTYKAAETNDTGNTVAEHAVVASVGIASVRVTGACAGGDLLESAGDGTARAQSDDIIRSSTLGKVTIGNSNTGEKLVSCVMYCG